MLKKMFPIFLFFSILISLVVTQLNCSQNNNGSNKEMSNDEKIARGKYLVVLGGCNHCHSPKVFTDMGPVPDTTKLLSGHPANSTLPPIDTNAVKSGKWLLTTGDLTAWVGPWGISYTANLTPDEPTGIGTWTEEVFMKALRTGKHMGIGRQILPPMPWADIGQSTDEDLKDIFAYLKSLPPINNQVPDPVPPGQSPGVAAAMKH